MEFSRSVILPFERQIVWDALNDPHVLRACIPGCESFEAPSDDHFEVVSVLKVGMIKARFQGAVDLSEIDAPNGYRISGSGKGGVAGYASGSAVVNLADSDGGTQLNYTANADVGGKIAQMGSRVIHAFAEKMANDFFQRFGDELVRKNRDQSLAESDAAGFVPSAVTGVADKQRGHREWLVPFAVGLVCGTLIGSLAVLALV